MFVKDYVQGMSSKDMAFEMVQYLHFTNDIYLLVMTDIAIEHCHRNRELSH